MTEMFSKDFLATLKKEPKPKFKLGDKAYFMVFTNIVESTVCGIEMGYTAKGKIYFIYLLKWNDGNPQATTSAERFLAKTKKGVKK